MEDPQKYHEVESFIDNPLEYEPRLHQDGTIVVELSQYRQLHIWSDSIPKPNRIRNHNWNFITTVLYGTFWQYRYAPLSNGNNLTHEIYDMKTLEPCNHKIRLLQRPLEKYVQGDVFISYAGMYYSTWTDSPACSIISKINFKPALFEPKLAVPSYGKPKRNLFEGFHPSSIPLIVEGACKRIRTALRSLKWKQIPT
jgi:hypothetical protein